MELETSPTDVKTTSSAFDCHFQVNSNNAKAASFTLRYELDKTTVTVKLDDIKESPGYELICVNLPRLVTVREEDADAWLQASLRQINFGGMFAVRCLW
jgi:hypothetical protein